MILPAASDGRINRPFRIAKVGVAVGGKAVVRGFDRDFPSLTTEVVNDREFVELS